MSIQDKASEGQAPTMNLGDLYYVVFRHKWKIILCASAGILTAALIAVLMKPPYVSEARLFLRYVRDARSVEVGGGQSQVKSPDARGETIINSEKEVLTSIDLATSVATEIGAEKILAKAGGGSNRLEAAILIANGLTVEVPKQSSVMKVQFQHPDSEITQQVLSRIIEAYLKKSHDVHQAPGIMDESLQKQADALRLRLTTQEEQLQAEKAKAGVSASLDEFRKGLQDQIRRIREELLLTQMELEERRAAMRDLEKAGTTNETPTAVSSTLAADKVSYYNKICSKLEDLRGRELEALSRFTEVNPVVVQVRSEIAEVEKVKKQMETENPRLASYRSTTRPDSTKAVPDAIPDGSRVVSLDAKARFLEAQLTRLQTNAVTVESAAAQINELQRNRDLTETNYRYVSASLEQIKFDTSLGESRGSIIVTQNPSPPIANGKMRLRLTAAALGGGFMAAFGLAFLIELVLDPSVKRPVDFERQLRVPLFLTVPYLPSAKDARLAVPELPSGPTGGPGGEGGSRGALPLSTAQDSMRTYNEALRDRLITYFQVRNMAHKPKLVGLTSASRGSGVTTVAAGLAAALSETGDGNVLLVDMSHQNGAAMHPFHKGKPGCGLMDALEQDKRTDAYVQDNLYMVTANDSQGKGVSSLPRRFNALVPKLKASDYDYVIFDLPPVSQTSPTPRLAGMLDMVFMVVESERTHVESVKRASALLAETKANVTAVLNKHRAYVPQRLSQEL